MTTHTLFRRLFTTPLTLAALAAAALRQARRRAVAVQLHYPASAEALDYPAGLGASDPLPLVAVRAIVLEPLYRKAGRQYVVAPAAARPAAEPLYRRVVRGKRVSYVAA